MTNPQTTPEDLNRAELLMKVSELSSVLWYSKLLSNDPRADKLRDLSVEALHLAKDILKGDPCPTNQ